MLYIVKTGWNLKIYTKCVKITDIYSWSIHKLEWNPFYLIVITVLNLYHKATVIKKDKVENKLLNIF